MGQALKKNINVISSTSGAIIGTLIAPGIGTIIGALVVGIPSLIITTANGIDGGPVTIGYSSKDGFSGGIVKENFKEQIDDFLNHKKSPNFSIHQNSHEYDNSIINSMKTQKEVKKIMENYYAKKNKKDI